MIPRPGASVGNVNALKHGLGGLKRRLRVHGLGGIDKRTTTARLLMHWRKDLIQDLGGEEALSAQQKALVESAARTMLLLGNVDAYLMEQESIVNRRKRCVLPVVRERIQLQDGLLRLLQALGLKRQPRSVPDLNEYLRQRAAEHAATEEPQDNTGGANEQ